MHIEIDFMTIPEICIFVRKKKQNKKTVNVGGRVSFFLFFTKTKKSYYSSFVSSKLWFNILLNYEHKLF